jgi:murein L,D-transpeptidase YcbB/YkuD
VAAKWHWFRGAPFGTVLGAVADQPEIAAFLKVESFEPDHRSFRDFQPAQSQRTTDRRRWTQVVFLSSRETEVGDRSQRRTILSLWPPTLTK